MSAPPGRVPVRYVLCPGEVRSRTDGQWHHIGARSLAFLYGVRMGDCAVMPPHELGALGGGRARRFMSERIDSGELIPLRPRYSGDYSLPPLLTLP